MKSALKKMAENFVPPIFMRVLKKIHYGRFMAKDGLDRKMQKYLNYNNGFYVELGANNGFIQSNTYYYEKHKNWKGVLIEPALNKYLECIANRSEKNFIFCAACVSFNYKEQFVPIAYSDFMSSPLNIDSDIENPLEHARGGEQYLKRNESVFVFGAKAETLNSLLKRANAPSSIDFLSLDVEGGELEVLSGIDHNTFRFKYMLIECRDFERMNSFLSGFNYSFVEKLSRHDYLFKDNKDCGI